METERILLRPWLDSDAETLFKYASDSDVGPRAGWPPHKFVEGSLEIIRTVFNAEGMWAVIWKDSGEAIGCVGYLPASASNLKIAEDHADVGYWIARSYWGKSICTEALQMVIDYCFNEKGFTTLWGDYFPSNPASGRVMEKCGYVVNIKLDAYSYMDYGILRGKITSLAQTPEISSSNTIVYTATVELTDNLNTTYKKKIPFIQQMTGQANIITEEMTLLDQIIRPIYSLFKN